MSERPAVDELMAAEEGTPAPIGRFLLAAVISGFGAVAALWAAAWAWRVAWAANEMDRLASLGWSPVPATSWTVGFGRMVAAAGGTMLYVGAAAVGVALVLHTRAGYVAWLKDRGVARPDANAWAAVGFCGLLGATVAAAVWPPFDPWLGASQGLAGLAVGVVIAVASAGVWIIVRPLDVWMHARWRAAERVEQARREASAAVLAEAEFEALVDRVAAALAERHGEVRNDV